MKEYRFVVGEENESERVDKYISEWMPDCSRSYLQKLIRNEALLLNGKVTKASALVKTGDEVFLQLPSPVIPEIEPQNMPLEIVYEDTDFLIINKPKDMVVHPAAGHMDHTVVNAVLYHCDNLSGINGVLRPGIVHRIDKDTTGLLIICKNDYFHNHIALQLKEHTIERTYHAIVIGNIKEDDGTVNHPLGRHPNDRKKISINPNGKEAITHYHVLERFGNYTYIRCNLETGRTHQIRVHMTSIGHPLLGDEIYGHVSTRFKTNGQVLHAKTIGFVHPSSGQWVSFDSELPEYFLKILKNLRSNQTKE